MRILFSCLVAGLTLFFWGGLTQMFPWGPSSAHVISAQASPELGAFHLRPPTIAKPGTLVAPAFDEAFSNRLGMLFTDETVSWISSKPISYYNGTAYLTRQIFTQLMIGTLLVALLLLIAPLGRKRSLVVVIGMGATASIATYGVMANWWGLAMPYAIGESANLVVGWVLASTLVSMILSTRFQSVDRSRRQGVQHG